MGTGARSIGENGKGSGLRQRRAFGWDGVLDKKERIFQRLDQIKANYEALTEKMGQPEVASDPKAFARIARQHRELEPIVRAYETYAKHVAERDEYDLILADHGDDRELMEMARDELTRVKQCLKDEFDALQKLLLPKDPLDQKNVILEIRAGTGGHEAALFAGEMFRAYSRFAEANRFKVQVTQIRETELGGIKEVTAVVEGGGAYSKLKYESGTHRVQRVPQTETQGRVHTSAITVAVLPEAEEIDVQIEDKDLRIDCYRSSGAGGQHVNTTDSAVRITHLPTNLVVTCQDEKSQIKNREKAMRVLRAHLFEYKQRQQNEQIAAARKNQVGSGDRSEKIRTYNFPQGRVTDHRIKLTLYQLERFMNGEMDDMVRECRAHFEALRIQDQFGSAGAHDD